MTASTKDDPAGGSASVRTRRIREFAREVLGYEKFRPGQERAMQAVVGGRDTLAVLPSGAGKTAACQARELAEHHEKVDQSRVEMMRGYAETTECRRQFLLGYFGEQLDQPCGNCDTCSAGTSSEHADDDAGTPFPVETPVTHSEWGAGVVMRAEDDRVTVLFDEVGYRTLALATVQEQDLLRGR